MPACEILTPLSSAHAHRHPGAVGLCCTACAHQHSVSTAEKILRMIYIRGKVLHSVIITHLHQKYNKEIKVGNSSELFKKVLGKKVPDGVLQNKRRGNSIQRHAKARGLIRQRYMFVLVLKHSVREK